MKRKTAIFILVAAALVFIFSVAQIFRLCREGVLLDLHEQELSQATEDQELYQHALELLRAGEWIRAQGVLKHLGDYRDSPALLQAASWQTHAQNGDSEALLEAYELLGSLPGGAVPQEGLAELHPALYELAGVLAGQFNLEEAALIWETLGDYEGSALLLRRARQAMAWAAAPEDERLLTETNRCYGDSYDNLYSCELGYIVLPEEFDADTRFFVYYPGGREDEMSIDYLLYYMMNPSPNTLAVFMRNNGLYHMEERCCQAIALLEQAAAERGLFIMGDIVAAGSSLGAYPAMHSVIYAYENYGLVTSCVLSLDAGDDWQDPELLLSRSQCLKTAELGTDFYLFESPWVGMNRAGIRRMVNTGNSVTMVGCYFDDHVRISLDAMGMGVVDWAVGDRSQPCNPEIYTFTLLQPES